MNTADGFNRAKQVCSTMLVPAQKDEHTRLNSELSLLSVESLRFKSHGDTKAFTTQTLILEYTSVSEKSFCVSYTASVDSDIHHILF
jgi:hypothetical protein